MKKLVIIRHGESEWNQKNLFTGWVDVELSDKGKAEAKLAGQLMKEAGLDFDVCYTSYLKRAINTQQIALKEMEREWPRSMATTRCTSGAEASTCVRP